ncbi:hypothetical protein ACN6MY_19845 [Peribacillus sp. B-H-3]|uniref:hypothetical protein n=1 Tax=Peribacillus sp. B-H-3 TaxID=3400420 RepID=UPI003B0292CD
MSQQKHTIVSVTLHSENKGLYSSTLSSTSFHNACTIITANVEFSFTNSVDEHVIQTVMRELKYP